MVRLPTQAELQENAHSSIVEGLGKRHPTEVVTTVTGLAPEACTVHWINRDGFERYVVCVDNLGAIKVVDIRNGLPRTVTTPNGINYLSTTNPRQDLAFLTVNDYTFVVNKKVQVAPTGTPPVASTHYVSFTLGNLVPGGYNFRYTLTVGAVTATCFFNSIGVPGWGVGAFGGGPNMGPSSGWNAYPVGASISDIAAKLAASLQAQLPGCLVRVEGGNTVAVYNNTPGVSPGSPSFQVLRWVDSVDYSAWVTPGAGVVASPGSITGTKQLFSQLPASPTVGDVWKIQGDPTNEFSAYYVKWDGGAWVETVAPANAEGLSPSTMPHVLIRQGDGTFVFKEATWAPRTVGDTETNPDTSVMGGTIRDIVYFRNRLGFIGGSGVSFSRAGDYFNFYRASVTTVLDTDPVDIQAAVPRAAQLNFAVPFAKQLVLFSDQVQLTLTTQDTLTPKTGAFQLSTEFEAGPLAKPILAGSNMYFTADRGQWASVREYYVKPYQATNDAEDITAHIPAYIPSGVFQLATSTTEDVVAALSSKDPSAMYVYKMYWKGEEKAQSSWSRWAFRYDRIDGIAFMGSVLWIAGWIAGVLYIEKIDMQPARTDAGVGYLVHLDHRKELVGTYLPGTDETRWDVPYGFADTKVAYGAAFTGTVGSILTTYIKSGDLTKLYAKGDKTTGSCIVGAPYTMRYRFSAQYMHDQKGQPISSADLRLRTFSVYYSLTGAFKALVTPKARATSTNVYTGRTLGTLDALVGRPSISDGVFTFPVLSDSKTVVIELVNDEHLPSFFQNAEWEGVVSMRSKRL